MKGKQHFIAIAIAVMMVSFCISLAKGSDSGGAITFTGDELYRVNCAGCHGADRSGNPPDYPSLRDMNAHLSKGEVQKILEKGKGEMADFSHLSEKERWAIIAFLLGEQPQRVELSPTALGQSIFKSNCASCHGASSKVPRAQKGCMMEPASLAGSTERLTKSEFFKILETGICSMPSFGHFTSEEREALYAFVETLEGKGGPQGPTMGEKCPMMKMTKMKKGCC